LLSTAFKGCPVARIAVARAREREFCSLGLIVSTQLESFDFLLELLAILPCALRFVFLMHEFEDEAAEAEPAFSTAS
jgi:hypothetical protein